MNNNNLFLFPLIWGDGHDAFREECLQKNVCSVIFVKSRLLSFSLYSMGGHICCSEPTKRYGKTHTCGQHCLPTGGAQKGDARGGRRFKSLLHLFLFTSELLAFFQTYLSFLFEMK